MARRLGRLWRNREACACERLCGCRRESVTLRGPVLRGEEEALAAAAREVAGVRELRCELEPHDNEADLRRTQPPAGHGDRQPAGALL